MGAGALGSVSDFRSAPTADPEGVKRAKLRRQTKPYGRSHNKAQVSEAMKIV
jgi:hypothetical protein